MFETAIKVENLSKKYYIGANKSGSFRETLQNKFNVLFGKKDPNIEEFWALKDINLKVKQGEVLGIIGKNGAGKTTILKILSKITEPTTGRIEINGKVSSLLEVGTGFHPELTGRENIYLNGTILGMNRNEVKSKFDEIVDFSGIEKFLDTPAKRYSSGMYVRLAFAVAAHLDPEILIIDEVLAVGDAEFQKKCLGKMGEVVKIGKTIIFVSHNMGAIHSLCKKTMLLDKGKLLIVGNTSEIIGQYLNNHKIISSFKRAINRNDKPTIICGKITMQDIKLQTSLLFEIEIFSSSHNSCALDVHLYNQSGEPIGFGSFGTFRTEDKLFLKKGSNRITFILDISNIAIGHYLVSMNLLDPFVEYYDKAQNILSFEIVKFTDDLRTLTQEWNYGSFQLIMKRND